MIHGTLLCHNVLRQTSYTGFADRTMRERTCRLRCRFWVIVSKWLTFSHSSQHIPYCAANPPLKTNDIMILYHFILPKRCSPSLPSPFHTANWFFPQTQLPHIAKDDDRARHPVEVEQLPWLRTTAFCCSCGWNPCCSLLAETPVILFKLLVLGTKIHEL